jgi:hypothetical protein
LPPCSRAGINYTGYQTVQDIPEYEVSSYAGAYYYRYPYDERATMFISPLWGYDERVYNLTQVQPIEITESPLLIISLDKNQAMVDEEITGYIISYGKNSIGSTVSLNAYVEFNNTKVPVTVNPNKLTISEGKDPSFTLKMPSYATFKS